jgi:hypothetical protein
MHGDVASLSLDRSLQHSGGAADRYGCTSFAINAANMDAAVWSRSKQLLQDPDLVARGVTTRQPKLARLVSTPDDNDVAAPPLNELRSLASQKRELEGEQRHLQDRVNLAAVTASHLREFASWCNREASNFATLTYEQKPLVLVALDGQACLPGARRPILHGP